MRARCPRNSFAGKALQQERVKREVAMGTRISTRILIQGAREVAIGHRKAGFVHAIRRDDPNLVSLEAASGRCLHVNWDDIAYVEETLAASSEGAPR